MLKERDSERQGRRQEGKVPARSIKIRKVNKNLTLYKAE
jgi:hypothetical protein